jgi:hypothetical protein
VSEGPERLFLFVQAELPWALGPPDGRYLLRSQLDERPERVVVLRTLTAAGPMGTGRRVQPAGSGLFGRRAARRPREAPPQPQPEPVLTTSATIIDPVPVSAERQAHAWLSEIDVEREIPTAFAALNRIVHAQRIAAADPYAREVSPVQALVIRAGWGEGEQVAEGMWLHAVQLPLFSSRERVRRRAATLRPDERLARLLAGRERPLLCEELALRARVDLDQGRPAPAALELDRALSAALVELADQQRGDLPLRVSELASLHPKIAQLAEDATTTAAAAAVADTDASVSDEETIRHALGRLEAALRARAAAGFDES